MHHLYMDNYLRFGVALKQEDAELLQRLTVHFTNKTGAAFGRPAVIRKAIQALAKKEKLA